MIWLCSTILNWLASRIQFFLVVGAFLLVASFVRCWFVHPNRKVFVISVVLLLLAGIGGLRLFYGPPDRGREIVDEDQLDDRPNIPDSALDRLREYWNSESIANWPAAETLAALSETAYLAPFEAERQYHDLGFKEVMTFVEGSMLGYVVTGEDVTVVIFRGTNSNEVSDWMANLSTSAMDTEHGAIHKGFNAAYHSMKWQIESILNERNTTHLWITGHSLGGALALVCAYDFVENEKRQIDGIITFGQPMVARKPLAKYLDELLIGKYARFVNREDIVPKVPPNHEPCGSLAWFTDAGLKRSKVHSIAYGAPPGKEPPPVVPTAPAEEDAEIQPLTEDEFREYQNQLKLENATKERLPEGTPAQMGFQAVGGPIDDHSMWEYLNNVRTLLGLNEIVPLQ